ncbi:MET15_2 [Sanghuangporus weigelae]
MAEQRFYKIPVFDTLQIYCFDSATNAHLFGLRAFGNIYSRIGNPTVDVFGKRMAALEGGVAAVAAASGHEAQFMAFSTIAGVGDNIVSTSWLYGGSFNQLKVFSKFGIKVKFVANDKPESSVATIRRQDEKQSM